MKQTNSTIIKNKNDFSISFSIKTQLILLTQQQKQTNMLHQLSLFPLKYLQLALGIDENYFFKKLNENQKKMISKQQKYLKYELLASVALEKLMKRIRKDCKSSFKSWKYAQYASYFSLFSSRIQHLNVEQQLQKISDAEEVLSTSNIGEEFFKELNFKILKLMFILEKIRIWIQMGDFIKSVKIYLINEKYLNELNFYEEMVNLYDKNNENDEQSYQQDSKKNQIKMKNKNEKNILNKEKQNQEDNKKNREKKEEKRKYQWILLLKSQIYITYAFTMQKVKELKKCILAYEKYIKLKEIIQVDPHFISELYKSDDQKNSYYSLYVFFFYKYCKSLIQDKQDEKALQSVYKIQQYLSKLQEQTLLKESEAQIFLKKFNLLSQRIEDLLKRKVVDRIQKQNDLLFVPSLKFKDEQLKQIQLFCKMSKQSEQENKFKQLYQSKSEGGLFQSEKSENSYFGVINTNHQDELKEDFELEIEGQGISLKNNQIDKSSSFFGSQQTMFDKFLDDDQHNGEQDGGENIYSEEEDDNLSQKYDKLIKQKKIEIDGLTNTNTGIKQMTPLNILLAQNEIVMNNLFNVKSYNTQMKANHAATNITKSQNLIQNQSNQVWNQTLSPQINLSKLNTTTLLTQPDSRRMSMLHSETARYRNNSLFSQNSQLLTTNYTSELQKRSSLFNRRSLHLPNNQHKESQSSKFNNFQSSDKDNNNASFSKRQSENKQTQKLSLKIQNQKQSTENLIQQKLQLKTTYLEEKNQFHNIYKKEYVRVYSSNQRHNSNSQRNHLKGQINNFNGQINNFISPQQTERQLGQNDGHLVSNNKRVLQNKQINSQFKKLQTKLSSQNILQIGQKTILKTENNSQERKDKVNLKAYQQSGRRQRTNYELIKDLDIEFELKYLLGQNNNKIQQFNPTEQVQLSNRPEINNEISQKQSVLYPIDKSFDSNQSNFKAVNKSIPNIINLIRESKDNQKIEKITEKYINLAKTDTVMRKKLNHITFENVFGIPDKSNNNLAKSELFTAINQRNHFTTGLKKLNDDQQLQIKKFGGVVYNEKKEDFEFMKADKYGVGFMNQDLEEKMKSVKEELKKIEIIPPCPPTKQDISFETETESMNMSNIDLNQQSAIISRFKQNLQQEMDQINETNLFINKELNQELSFKSSVSYRSTYKSQFQKYANKDYFINAIAQHNITIQKGEDLDLQSEEEEDEDQNNIQSDSNIDGEDQEKDEEISQNLDQQRKEDDCNYSYSLADNLSDLNKSSISNSIIIPQLSNLSLKYRNSQRQRGGSIFRIYNQVPQKRDSRDISQMENQQSIQQETIKSNYVPILQNVFSPKNSERKEYHIKRSEERIRYSQNELKQQTQTQNLILNQVNEENEVNLVNENNQVNDDNQVNRFKQYTREKKLSIAISGSQIDSKNQSQQNNIQEFDEQSPIYGTEQFIDYYGNGEVDYMKNDFSSYINNGTMKSDSKPLPSNFIRSNQVAQQFQRAHIQRHNTDLYSERISHKQYNVDSSPLMRQLSTNFLFAKSDVVEDQISPTASPFSLKKVFSKFKTEKNQDNGNSYQIQESPTRIQNNLNIEIHYNRGEDLFNNKLSNFRTQRQGPSFASQQKKRQQSKHPSLFKLKLQNTSINENTEKALQSFKIIQSQKLNNGKQVVEEEDQERNINQILKLKSIQKIQKYYRMYISKKQKKSEQILSNQNQILVLQKGQNQSEELQNFLSDYGLRNLLTVRLFFQKIKYSQSGAINNQSGHFMKFYPPFKFTRLIQGVPVRWKVKHQYKREMIMNTEYHNYFLMILYGNTRFSIKVDLEYASMQLRGIQYETLWPLYLVGFEKYLRDQNIKINVVKPQNDFKKLPYSLSFFEAMTQKIQNKITDFDLNCVGNLKDLLDLFLRHFFEYEQKVNGLVLEYNKNQIFPQWKLISVKKSQKKLDRFIATSIEGKRHHKEDLKKHKKEYEMSLQQNERILQNNLVRFMKENHLLGVFIKRSTGGYYYLLTVKVNFRQSNDISTQIVNGQLMLSDFSFYITGRNLGTYQTILPLEVHASQVSKYFKTNTLIREINKFFLKKRLSNRWITILVNFFSSHLCLTLPKVDRQGLQSQKSYKVQKLIFRDLMELKRRIQSESQKQILLQNPFNDFFLLEQVNRNKSSIKQDQIKQIQLSVNGYENLVLDNFNNIYKTFKKSQRDDHIEKNDYSLFQEDDELDKKYEDGNYLMHEEILKIPPQEELIDELETKQLYPDNQKQVKQGNQIRRKNNIDFINLIDLPQQLEGFWRLSNLFGNGRCLRQKVFFSQRGAYIWIIIKMDIIKGLMVVSVCDYRGGETHKQVLTNQKVKQLIINMTTLVPEKQLNMSEYLTENLKQIAFQGILEKEKILLGQKIKIKVQREEDTLKNPVILNNRESIKNHLLIDSVELKKHYDFDEYTSLLIHKQLGKLICSIKVFILNKESDNQVVNTYLFRLTIQLYNSKHYQFKIILGFDDLYLLDQQLYSNLLKQYKKIYSQKLISLIMNRLQLVATVQGKVPCFLNFPSLKSNQKEEQIEEGLLMNLINNQNYYFYYEIGRQKINETLRISTNNVNPIFEKGSSFLRYKRNRFAKTSHNQQNNQQQKTMLEDYVQQSRVIFQGIKKFQNEYCIVTVSKDILLRYWVFNIYIPKTSRVLVSYFNNSDMMDCSEEFLSKQMSQKIIYFFENPQMTPFKNYQDFIKRIALQNNNNNNQNNVSQKHRKHKHHKKIMDRNIKIPPNQKIMKSEDQIKQDPLIPVDFSKVDNELIRSPSMKRKSSSKHRRQQETINLQQREQRNEKKRCSVLDIKFEFSNFSEKFNNLREVFQPGIQKKRSISLESLPSQSSNTISPVSPQLSPVIFKYSRENKRRNTNLQKKDLYETNQPKQFSFQFNNKPSKEQQPMYKSINLKSIQEKQTTENRRKQFLKQKTIDYLQLPDNSEQKMLLKLQPVESFLSKQRNQLGQTNLQQNRVAQMRKNQRSRSQFVYQRDPQQDKEFLFQNNLQFTKVQNNFINYELQNGAKSQPNQQMNSSQVLIKQNNQILKQNQENANEPSIQPNILVSISEYDKKSDFQQLDDNNCVINQDQILDINEDNYKINQDNQNNYDEIILKQSNQIEQSKNIILENQKIVNKLFNGDLLESKRASLIISSKKQKQDLQQLYISILKQKAFQQQKNVENEEDDDDFIKEKPSKFKLAKQGQEKHTKQGQDSKTKCGLQYFIKKHFIKLLVVIHIQQYIDMKRVGNKVKIQRTQKFFDLTKVLDDAFIQKQHNVRITNLCKFIEIRLWENLINQSRLEADVSSEHMLFCVENSKLPLHELMFHDFMQIDNNTNHEFNTEICINFIDIVSNKGLKQARKRMKNTNKKMKTKKEMMENFYFTPLDWISYPMTTYFNMYIQNFHLEEGFIQTDVINLREILNIYIAEGYYKYQTNYINSKLNYSDIKSLCQFIVHKMKTSNFLNLMKSQISGNNEGFSQKFSIEENIRQKANYMKRIKTEQDKLETPIINLDEKCIKERHKRYSKIDSNESKTYVISKVTVLNPIKGLILKSQYTPSLKEFKFVVLQTNTKSNTTRYKQFEFFSKQIKFLDFLQKAQSYKIILDKVVVNFKNQMLLYHDTNN